MLKYKRNLLKIICIFIVAIFLLPAICIASDTIYTWSNSAKPLTETIPTNATTSLNLNVGSAVLIEQNSE